MNTLPAPVSPIVRRLMRATCRPLRFLGLLAALALSQALAQAQQPPACPPAAAPPDAEMFRAAARTAADRGFLWRITRDGRTSHLYGTLHVGRPEWIFPGPRLQAALQASDVLAMELDVLDEGMHRDMAQALAAAPARAVPAPLRARLAAAWASACMPPGSPAQGPVELRAVSLMLNAGRAAGLEAIYGSEFILALLSRANRLPAVSLETAASQVQALLADSDADAQHMVADTLDGLADGRLLGTLRKTADVWQASDLDALDRYFEWCECVATASDRKLMTRLLDGRNPGMAAGIEKLHAAGRRVFAAVGAMHMQGPGGLPALLRARGFTVERIH